LIEDLVVLRALEEPEINFVYHSWLRSLRSGNSFYKSIPSIIYFENHRKQLYKILDRSHCLVASPKDHPEIIVAYIVWENFDDKKEIIHYIYVKSDYRVMGLANLLVEVAAGDRNIVVTHKTDSLPRNDRYIFNPYLMEN
jgi:hypothetical protein